MVQDVHKARCVRRVLWVGWCLGWWLAGALPVHAAPYEVEPESVGAQDLLALVEEGAISAETLSALLALRRTGVDLGLASRASLYGLPGLTYSDVDVLLRSRGEGSAAGGALTEAASRRLAPFLDVRTPGRLSGDARLMMAFAASDGLPPPLALQVRAGGLAGLRAGLMTTLARRTLAPPRRDARRRAFVVEAPGTSVTLPKLYVQWTGARASLLAGTYRLGFGQRLTLDTTALPSPDGFLPDDDVRPPAGLERSCLVGSAGCEPEERLSDVTPDFRWDEGFRGVAGTVRGPLGTWAALSLTGFGSYQSRALARHAVLDRSLCPSSARGACKAPDVWVSVAEGRWEKLTARTLSGMFRELAGGGNATLAMSSRSHVGLTGWMARPMWGQEGAKLDFQPNARYPAGGAFGAFGLDAAWGRGALDVFLEGTRSFDAAPGGGGDFGAVQRTVLSGGARELELSLRYYGRGFANPYSGAPSGPDALEGLRVRNELGARLRYLHREEGAWRLRGQVDAWTLPADGAVSGSAGTLHARASVRGDLRVRPWLQPSLQVELRDNGVGGMGACADDSLSAQDVADLCASARYGVTARVRSDVAKGLTVSLQYGHARVQAPETKGLRYDAQAVLDVRAQPLSSLKLHGRLVWKDQDLSERSRLQQELRTALDVAWRVSSAVSARGRYAWVLDLKDARVARVPPDPPRHLFHLELETRF
ncbi:hypothetical protein MXAN_0568 [Myxococcus xanthus DK 1622]|uniref:Uncharacterized protein n=1 Tax=Myxococcus xanthus (strain DK1622) TaxID=246197 RepID=Q1DET6_MYXXD|nr:hypothetical protein MXAN_0568 [Myxococcus xanthus DK 1622]NOJ57253.1 hypothetical protein [Myxococcus xanthus]QVW69329.1 hypothetical protein JTM82_07200 [Myxococcus xanthus DZ2]QPM80265.1 hypothetical protein I5Q59_02910 [Myxococcus xanthus]QZZ48112.1 hypothetical protein MyxoNM_02810 [Myxococcus xanthus]